MEARLVRVAQPWATWHGKNLRNTTKILRTTNTDLVTDNGLNTQEHNMLNVRQIHERDNDIKTFYPWNNRSYSNNLSKPRWQRERHRTKWFNVQNNGFARAFSIFVHFFRPLHNNNAKWLSSAYFRESKRRRLIFRRRCPRGHDRHCLGSLVTQIRIR